MQQVKFFSTYDPNELDKMINAWLTEHPHIPIKDIKLSNSVTAVDDDEVTLFTALIIYKAQN